jgi:hypothetical protein
VGLAQEGLQLISGMQILRWNTLLDLGVDAASALVGCLVVIGLRKLRGKVSSHGVS